MFASTRFVLSTSLMYAATLVIIGYALITPRPLAQTHTRPTTQSSPPPPDVSRPAVISGTPSQVSLPTRNLDLPVYPGHYDEATGAWTLSDTHAQFATLTMPVNDTSGTTLIYGHATPSVFGNLAATPIEVGTIAQVKSTDGTTFNYTFTHSETLSPSDTSLFQDVATGSPRLVLQTCTGTFSEWRTMYYFAFEGVTAT